AHCFGQRARCQPDLMAGANFGRNARKFERQILDQGIADRGFELACELLAADQAASVQADVEIAENVAHLQSARPLFQRVEMAGDESAADYGADRGADHDIGADAVGKQGPNDADMGKAACGATAERKSDDRPANAAETDLVAAFSSVLATPGQTLKHRKLLEGPRLWAAVRP